MPSPYTRDLFAAVVEDGRIDPTVFYMELSAPDTHWTDSDLPDYAEVLPGRWINVMGGRVHVNPGALQRVLREQPDVVVIGGYSSLTSQRLMRGLNKAGIPWIFWGESPGMRPHGVLRRALRSVAMRPVIGQACGVAAIGSTAQAAYSQEIAGRCPVENIPYCCDMESFRPTGTRKNADTAVRFLFCGQLIHRKGVDLLFDAFAKLATEYSAISLELVGTGPDEAELKRQVPAGLKSRVHFRGFQAVADLPQYFNAADVFVLPSRHDGWGVVVNQAIAAGLPVICSSKVGAAADLVVEDCNGFIVPSEDTDALAHAMRRLIEDPSLRTRFGRTSIQLAEEWTPARTVDRWYHLISTVLNGRPVVGRGV